MLNNEVLIKNIVGNNLLTPLMVSILELIPDGIFVINSVGEIIYVNKAVTQFLGYEAKELVGLNQNQAFKMLLEKHHNLKAAESTWKKIRDGENTSERRRFIHKTGQSVPLEAKGYPLYNEDGSYFGKIFILRDLHKELLLKVISLINSSLSLHDVLHNTTEAIVEHLGLSSNAVFVFNAETKDLQLVSCNVVEKEQDLAKVVFKLGEGSIGKSALQRKPYYVRNLHKSTEVPEFTRQVMGDISSISFPLTWKEDLLGVIAFDADTVREFSEQELKLFESIAHQVSLALYNSKAFSTLEHISVTDFLTGVYNHRYFRERLSNEIQKVQENAHSFGLLMIDVDYFKNYNDNLGHPTGDSLLKEITEKIKQSIRGLDILARYGGEEFAVILTGCSLRDATIIAEEIRKNVENSKFYGREYQPNGRVSVSIGVVMSDQTKSQEQLIEDADKALYLAKQRGRNRVEIA